MNDEKQLSENLDNEQKMQDSQSKPKKHWLRWGLFLILLVFVIPFLFLATGYGQRKTVEWVDRWVEPLKIGKIEGSLQEGLRLSNTQFVTEGIDVNIGQADLHIGFECLIRYEVCLNHFKLRDTAVTVDTTKLPPSPEKENKEPFKQLNLPLSISAKQLELNNIDVKVDDMEIQLDHFHTAISGKGRAVTLHQTELDGLNLLLALQMDAKSDPSQTKGAIVENTVIDAQYVAEQVIQDTVEKTGEKVVESLQLSEISSTQSSHTKIDWALIKSQLERPLLDKQARFVLPLDLIVEAIDIRNVAIAQKAKDEKGNGLPPIPLLNIESFGLQAQVNEQQILLQRLNFKSNQGDLNATGTLSLQDDYPLSWHLEGKEAHNAKVKLPINEINATISGKLYDKTTLHITTKGAVNASLDGDVELSTPRTPFDLRLKSETTHYPFSPKKAEDVLKLENVDIQLKGDLLAYDLAAKLNAKGLGIPPSFADLKGQGELTHFNLQHLMLNTLEGQARLKGSVDWTNGVAWDSDLHLNNINTKSLLADWPAVLSGTLASTGYAGQGQAGKDWKVDVSNVDMKGTLQQKNLQLKGDLQASHQQLLNVPALSLNYGENKIDLKGILGEKSDFYADINAPNLQGLVPSLKAGINGTVRLSGKVAEPHLDVDLAASNVSYEQLKLQHLTAKGKITTEKVIQGNVELALKQFAYNDIKVDSALLKAQGNEANHTLNFTSKGDPVGVDLQLSGKFDRLQQLWQGQLSQMGIQTTEWGKFQADKAVNLKYDNKAINANVSSHCWHNPKATLCFPTSFNAGTEGKVPFEVRQFDLSVLQQYLDKNSQLSGIVNLKGDAAWFKSKQPEVNAELTSHSIKFLQKMEGGKSFPLTISPAKLNVKMAENNLAVKADLNVENNGKLTTDLVMKDLARTRTLSGNLQIDQLTLKLIRPLLSKGDSVEGNINARLKLGGSATSPLLHGNLNLTDLKARSTIMPFDVTNGHLAMNFAGATSSLQGRIQTNQSELRLEGDADWRNLNAWKTRVHAQANRFQVDIPNIAKVAVSPNVQVTVTPTLLTLSGNIDIPWARIEVEELPESAVNVSGDEVIMEGIPKSRLPFSQRNLPVQPSNSMAINADVKINIGNDVRLKAYGLNSYVNGLLSVRQDKQGLGLYGQVRLNEGRFAAYGQDLLIRKGNVSFAGSPSQPTLDIEAIRNPEAMEDPTITAGVRVTGLADNPTVKVFSNPTMSQSEALSYILTGRSLDSSGEGSSSNAMAAALLGMSLSKSSKLVGDVGSAFGLKDLSVTTAGIGDNTKVEVSASLAPKFRVKYGVGIFAPLTELTLRYNLTPKLYLQWVSSINQAVDLMYRFEFDELF